MQAFAHDRFSYPLPDGHRFPLEKYRLLRGAVDQLATVTVEEAPAVGWNEIARAHEQDYVERVQAGALSRREQLAVGLPWSPELVERARRSAGATLAAARVAFEDGVGANLGGGTHHAFAASGHGFCIFNDVVVARRVLEAERRLRRVLIVDLDVHQGDGTHALLTGDSQAFTFSVNGFRNFPFRRVPGDLELDLEDGTGDDEYLGRLEPLLAEAIGRSRPEMAFYLAGADPYAGDRLGRLALSKPGLADRDRLVRDVLRRAGVPVCVTLAGGYAEDIRDTVDINVHTIEIFTAWRG